MKKFKSVVILTALFTFNGLNAELAYSSSGNDELFGHPLPKDDDIVTTFGKPSMQALNAKRIKILVWNLHKGQDDMFLYDYRNLSQDKDIVLAQEVLLNTRMTHLFKSLAEKFYVMATSFFMNRELNRTGVANVSAVNPSYFEYFRTKTLEPVVNSPKVAMISTYPIKGTDVQLTSVNIHGINFVDNLYFERELKRLSERLKQIKGPMIFAGDFNTWNPRRTEFMTKLTQSLNLSEASFYPDNRMTFDGNYLDHFYYSKEIKIISAKVDGFYLGSDHKPLEVEIELDTPVLDNSL